MENVIIILILAAIVGGILWYLYKAKRRGDKCIGCPYAKECRGKCSSAAVNSIIKPPPNEK